MPWSWRVIAGEGQSRCDGLSAISPSGGMPGRGAYNGTTMPSMRVWSQGLCTKVAFDDEGQLCVLEQLLLALQRPVQTDPSATFAALS